MGCLNPKPKPCVGFGCFALTLRFFANSHMMHLWTGSSARSPTRALLHRFLPSNLSTTTQGDSHCETAQSFSRVVYFESESVLGQLNCA